MILHVDEDLDKDSPQQTGHSDLHCRPAGRAETRQSFLYPSFKILLGWLCWFVIINVLILQAGSTMLSEILDQA